MAASVRLVVVGVVIAATLAGPPVADRARASATRSIDPWTGGTAKQPVLCEM